LVIVISSPRSGSSSFVEESALCLKRTALSEVLNPESSLEIIYNTLGSNRYPKDSDECMEVLERVRVTIPNSVCKIMVSEIEKYEGLLEKLLGFTKHEEVMVIFFERKRLFDKAISLMLVLQREGWPWNNIGYKNIVDRTYHIDRKVMDTAISWILNYDRWFKKSLDVFWKHDDVLIYEDLLGKDGILDSNKVCTALMSLKIGKASPSGNNKFKKTSEQSYKDIISNYPQVLMYCKKRKLF